MSKRLTVFLACVMAAACGRSQPPEVRIGLMATFTGPFAEVSGIPTRQGAQLAVRESGDTVTIGGRVHRVVLVERGFDDRADAAAGAARALINQEGVAALIGPQFSRHAIPAAVVAEDAGVPMITPMSSNPATTTGRRFIFRLAFLDDVQGPILARFARDSLHARTAAVLYDISGAYSSDLAAVFRREFEARGGRIAAFEAFTADQVDDARAQLGRIAAARPDVVFMPAFPDALARHIPVLERLGVRATLLGSDSWDPPALPALRPGQRTFVTSQWRPDLPTAEARRFTDAYRAAFGTEPRATAAMTYDATRILLAALRRAGTSAGLPLRDAIAATDAYEGATGTVAFRGGGDPGRQVAISEVRGKDIVTVMLSDP